MANKYYPTIGLEVHAQLKTDTKMFCSCKNDPDEQKPNTNICPVCMAHPGALPVANKLAIEQVIKVGLSIGGEIADFSEFDRKNYFYPDIPKGYQISQYKFPIVSGGHLADFDVTRIHLEEDTANNKHTEEYSLIDFNRAGIPLMELVTEPHTFDNAEEAGSAAGRFAKEYQLLLWYLGAADANMEKGEMRVEANVSVSTDRNKKSENYVEVKNLNSFRSVERAIRYEVQRMANLIEEGKEAEIVKETRGWDENKQQTFSQRKKEGSADYRYFPEPDLPKMKLHQAFSLEEIKDGLPELPEEKRARYQEDFGIKEEDVEVFVNDVELGGFYEEVVKFSKNIILEEKEFFRYASNFITSDYIGIKKANPEVKLPSAKNFAELIEMFSQGEISSRVAKDILAMMVVKDESPLQIATEKNLLQTSDTGALKEIAQKIIDANPKAVADYQAGKEAALMSLVGQIMKETKGSANPSVARTLLIDLLK